MVLVCGQSFKIGLPSEKMQAQVLKDFFREGGGVGGDGLVHLMKMKSSR